MQVAYYRAHVADEKSEAENGEGMHGCSGGAGYTIQLNLVPPVRDAVCQAPC